MYSHKKRTKKATGGLMDMPPYIAKEDKTDDGISPYDIKTPESARKGLPSRLLGKTRTRFNKGDVAFKDPNDFPDDDDRNPDDGYPLPGDNIKLAESVKDKLIKKQIKKLENQKEVLDDKVQNLILIIKLKN